MWPIVNDDDIIYAAQCCNLVGFFSFLFYFIIIVITVLSSFIYCFSFVSFSLELYFQIFVPETPIHTHTCNDDDDDDIHSDQSIYLWNSLFENYNDDHQSKKNELNFF